MLDRINNEIHTPVRACHVSERNKPAKSDLLSRKVAAQ